MKRILLPLLLLSFTLGLWAQPLRKGSPAVKGLFAGVEGTVVADIVAVAAVDAYLGKTVV